MPQSQSQQDSEPAKALPPDDFCSLLQVLNALKDDMDFLIHGQAEVLKGVEDIRAGKLALPVGTAGTGSPSKSVQLRSSPGFQGQSSVDRDRQGSPAYISNESDDGCEDYVVQPGSNSSPGRPVASGVFAASPSASVSKLARSQTHDRLADGAVPVRGHWWSEDNVQRSQPTSIGGWPSNIKMRKALEASKNTLTREAAREKLAKAKTNKLVHSDDSEASKKKPWLFRIHDPNSRIVTMYDFMSLAAFANDLLVTPYVVAWELTMNETLYTLAFLTAFYWTSGILVKARTGYYHGGELKMDQKDILRHYARTDLLLDVLLVLIDWTALALSPAEGSHSNSSLLRFSKLFRITKVLRLAHVWRLIEKSMQASELLNDSTVQTLAVRLLQVVLSTVLFTHIMSCAWYSIGLNGRSDTEQRWLETFMLLTPGEEEVRYEGVKHYDNGFTYTSSFHWTLAQITLGAMEINPTNSYERSFCVVLLLVGMIFNATIVSLISSQTMAYVQTRREHNSMMDTLSRFLDQNKVDTKLQVRVRRQVLDRLALNRLPLTEEDVAAINVMSVDLKRQLLVRTREKYLLTHALFRTWAQTDSAAMRELCDDEKGPLQFHSFKSQDIVFFAGQDAEGARLAVQGKFRYTAETVGEETMSALVSQGDWICEAALWSHWIHVGRLEADGSSQMMLLKVGNFIRVLQKFELVAYLTREYGRAYHGRITTSGPPFSDYPSDLHVPNTDASDLVSQDVGLELLRRERDAKDGKLAEVSESAYAELLKEVDSEKCSIVQAHNGELQRTVALVAVKITRNFDDRVFVEVGTWNRGDGEVNAGCALPAKKRVRSELPRKAFEQILAVNLQQMQDMLELVPGRATSEVEVKDSAKFGLKTRYLRSILEVCLADEYSFQDVPTMTDPYRTQASVLTGGSRPRRSSLSSLDSMTRNSSLPMSKTRLEEDLAQQDVYLLQSQPRKYRLYAWLLPRTVEFLRSDEGQAECTAWISRLLVPPELTMDRSEELSKGLASFEPLPGISGQIMEEETSEVSEI
mmetsp:Transcript_35344/g.82594  ORF Transcript_35344/g.82594 Transcript_35344/m.82594 type:complete len:1032 (+) Transcript_35344:96-3191(+)